MECELLDFGELLLDAQLSITLAGCNRIRLELDPVTFELNQPDCFCLQPVAHLSQAPISLQFLPYRF